MSQYYRNASGIQSGYYVRPNSKINAWLDMINYKEVARTVYIESIIDYLPGKQEGWLDSSNAVINLGMCDGPAGTTGFQANKIHAPAGVTKFSLKSENPVEIVTDGYIVAASKYKFKLVENNRVLTSS
jgi:hypothetical protein